MWPSITEGVTKATRAFFEEIKGWVEGVVSAAKTEAEAASDPAGTAAADVKIERERAETAEALLAPKVSPTLTGTPKAPTATALTSNTQLATTAYADSAVAVEKGRAETVEVLKAPLASPLLTGTPTAPTATGGTNTAQVATTAFVQTAKGEAESKSRPVGTKIVTNTPHAWVVPGAAAAETLPGLTIVPATGETVKLVRIDYKIREGTKVTFKLQKGGVDITGFTGLEAKTEAKHTAPTAVALAEGEELTLVITAVEGSPKGFSATIQVEHSAS